MPVMDGFEATRIIRENERESKVRPIPIIALTAHAMEDSRQRCLQARMDDFLAKPIKIDELVKKLQKYSSR